MHVGDWSLFPWSSAKAKYTMKSLYFGLEWLVLAYGCNVSSINLNRKVDYREMKVS